MRKRGIALALLGLLAAAGTLFGVAQVAEAAVPTATLGALTVEDVAKTGLDTSAPHYTTATGCPADADGYNLYIYGPGVFAPGLIATTTTDVGLAHDAGFPIFQGLSFKDIALDHQGTVLAGRYHIVANCVDTFSLEVKGTFTMPLWFTVTDKATTYTTTDPSAPTTTTATSTSGSASATTTTGSTSSDTASSSATSTTESTTGTDAGGALPTDTTSAASSTGTETTAGGQKLASTGVPTGPLALVGLGLLGAGIVAVLVARRRREVVRSAWPE